MASPKWKKLGPGHYQTADGLFSVKRVTSQQTGRRTEVCWEIIIHNISGDGGQVRPYCEESLRDAKQVVSAYY